MDIGKQYDTNSLAHDYVRKCAENLQDDPGRVFLQEQLSLFPKNLKILDIGCGNGFDLASYYKSGFTSLCGIDPSNTFVGEAKTNLEGKAEIVEGRFENIPFGNGSMDIITSRFSLHYVKDITIAIGEVARVLKQGGKFLVVADHPFVDMLEEKDAEGNISVTLFNKTVTISFPQHSLSDYFSPTFFQLFNLELLYEYKGEEQDRASNGLANTLCFVASKR